VSEVARRISIKIKPMVERSSSKADETVQGKTEGQTGIRRLALGVHEAADLLGVSSYTLRRNIERRQIHAIRVGRRVLIPTKELERVLADKSAPSGASSSQSL
jgi:excisionase family DNA binding protein